MKIDNYYFFAQAFLQNLGVEFSMIMELKSHRSIILQEKRLEAIRK